MKFSSYSATVRRPAPCLSHVVWHQAAVRNVFSFSQRKEKTSTKRWNGYLRHVSAPDGERCCCVLLTRFLDVVHVQTDRTENIKTYKYYTNINDYNNVSEGCSWRSAPLSIHLQSIFSVHRLVCKMSINSEKLFLTARPKPIDQSTNRFTDWLLQLWQFVVSHM